MRSARARCGSLFVDRVSIDHSPQDYDVRSTDIAAVETPNCRHSPATLEGPEWVESRRIVASRHDRLLLGAKRSFVLNIV